jgi:predicted Holliday junction resolvase-like endonuclease
VVGVWLELLILVIIVLSIVIFLLYRKNTALSDVITDLNFRKSSQSVKYGQLTEQWIPFAENFPFDSQTFRFLGNPIDGLAFTDDKIIFCEFKTNTSGLNTVQKKIKDLVKNKKVDWLEFRIK